jgi:hypothetical protein
MNNTNAAQIEVLARLAMADGDKPFSVLLFGSHPAEYNDDCWTGYDFDTQAQAEAFMANIKAVLDTCKTLGLCKFDSHFFLDGTTHLQLDGAGVAKVVQIAQPRSKAMDNDWQSEIAHQAGMMGGCDAYNDEMGY